MYIKVKYAVMMFHCNDTWEIIGSSWMIWEKVLTISICLNYENFSKAKTRTATGCLLSVGVIHSATVKNTSLQYESFASVFSLVNQKF
jgi:hypothetical protein